MADKRIPAPLLLTLMALTTVSGLVDAVCYLGLGHVFTANMTGNVVVLGFAAAGAPGFSFPATFTSLVLFLAGAFCAGWAAPHLAGGKSPLGAMASRLAGSDDRRRLLLSAMTVETCFIGVAALIAALAATVATGWARYLVIALLAFAMGVRNATVRRLAVPDMTTTVLTMTLTGLAADSFAGGGQTRSAEYRRAGAVAAMLAGAIAGAAMFLHVRAGLPLLVAMLIVAAAGVAYRMGAWRA